MLSEHVSAPSKNFDWQRTEVFKHCKLYTRTDNMREENGHLPARLAAREPLRDLPPLMRDRTLRQICLALLLLAWQAVSVSLQTAQPQMQPPSPLSAGLTAQQLQQCAAIASAVSILLSESLTFLVDWCRRFKSPAQTSGSCRLNSLHC